MVDVVKNETGLRIVPAEEAARSWNALGDDLALIPNGEEAYPPFDVVPLAPKRPRLEEGCVAVLLDMDGTLTTTEQFTCAAMEQALRRMMGPGGADWPGLSVEEDFPALIGYSGADNMRYLHPRVGGRVNAKASARAFLEAARWVFGPEADPAARDGVRALAIRMGWTSLSEDCRFHEGDADALGSLLETLPLPAIDRLEFFGPIGLTIYAHEYHELLSRLEKSPPGALIGPMPGAAELLAIVHGALGEEAGALAPRLGYPAATAQLAHLGAHFAQSPARTALVTSSTRFEASHALNAVLRAARETVGDWPVNSETKKRVMAIFEKQETAFDVVVTSSDHPPFAVKPRRDPYALALCRLGLGAADLHRVIGFEDTAPGIISLRGAGVGCAVALPFEGTAAHDFSVAANIAEGGLPEVLAERGLYLDGVR